MQENVKDRAFSNVAGRLIVVNSFRASGAPRQCIARQASGKASVIAACQDLLSLGSDRVNLSSKGSGSLLDRPNNAHRHLSRVWGLQVCYQITLRDLAGFAKAFEVLLGCPQNGSPFLPKTFHIRVEARRVRDTAEGEITSSALHRLMITRRCSGEAQFAH